VLRSAINDFARYEIRVIIRFLHPNNMSFVKIHRELCAVYCNKRMSKGTVRQWCRMFKDGRTDAHDEERSGRPHVVSGDLFQSVDQKL
jgi:transposase